MIKRLFDVVVASGVLLLSWPLILVGAAAVKVMSAGPVFYRARRAGLRGQPFDMFKIRTMGVGADAAGAKVTAEGDARVMPVGRVLRRFKIDELPQFWNVLRGDMSVVGPRPEDWEIVQQYYTPAQRHTLDVRPGIVSPAEVRWFPDLAYHDPPPDGVPLQEYYLRRHMPAQAAEGLCYVEKHNLLLDLKVIVQTIFCVLYYSWRPPERKPLPKELTEAGPLMDCGTPGRLHEGTANSVSALAKFGE